MASDTNNISIQAEIEKHKKGKKEISNSAYQVLWVISLTILSCLAFQNAIYGAVQSRELIASLVLAVLYGAGDFALSTIAAIFSTKRSAHISAFLASAGLVLLSFTAGLAFLLMLGHQNDVATSRVAELKKEIETNRILFEQHSKTITANRIQILKQELAEEEQKTGADKSSVNAIYVYASQVFGYSYKDTALAIKAFWIAVLIVTSFSLSTLKGNVWSPGHEIRLIKSIGRQRAQKRKAMKTLGGTPPKTLDRKKKVETFSKKVEPPALKVVPPLPKKKKGVWHKKTEKAFDQFMIDCKRGVAPSKQIDIRQKYGVSQVHAKEFKRYQTTGEIPCQSRSVVLPNQAIVR